MGEHNLTPAQRAIPKPVRVRSYYRLPMTCDNVRAILDETMVGIMTELGIDASEAPTVDAHISRAFQRIRDEVTQPFRTAHMQLLYRLLREGIDE